jgi:hypothetical protein
MRYSPYLLLVFLFLLLGCAGAPSEDASGDGSSEPIPQPTMGDEGILLATPTPALIAITSRSDIVNPDGTVTQSLTLQDNRLGIGQVVIHAPNVLSLGDGGIITLTLFPAPPALGEEVAPLTQTGETNTTQSITQTATIYPVMKADLTGTTFSIEMDGDPQRLVTTDSPTEWLWSIQPRESGAQNLVASLSIPVQVEGSEVSTSRVVETFPLTIMINKTFAQRMEENMEVILTTVLGVVGGGLTLGWRAWRNRVSRKSL